MAERSGAGGGGVVDTATELRVRAVLERWYPVLVAILVVLSLLGGWVTYTTYQEPGTHTERRQVSSWGYTAEFEHDAEVVRPNPVFPVGARLTDRRFYFTAPTPVLNGSFVFAYTATDEGSLALDVETEMVVRALGTVERPQAAGDGTIELWSVGRPLSNRTIDGVPPGERVSVPFRVDVPDLRNRSENITERLGGTPGELNTTVRTTVTASGTVNGREVDRQWVFQLPVGGTDNVYRVHDPGRIQGSQDRTETVQVRNTYGPLRQIGAPLLAVVSLLGLGLLVLPKIRESLSLSPHERELLDYYGDKEDFDEWIVTIQLPERARELPTAEADSLADLVNLAIDTNNSVLKSPDGWDYFVVHDGYLYTYSPPRTGQMEWVATPEDDHADDQDASEGRTETEKPTDDEDTSANDEAGTLTRSSDDESVTSADDSEDSE